MKSPQQMHLIQGSKEVLLYCSLETIRRLFSLQPFILSWNHMDSQLWVLVRTSIACLILCLEACTIFLFSPSLDWAMCVTVALLMLWTVIFFLWCPFSPLIPNLLNKYQSADFTDISRSLQYKPIVCHRGPARFGHWVSYYRIQNKWYISDDSCYVRLVNGNPLIGIGVNEIVDLLWFKTC